MNPNHLNAYEVLKEEDLQDIHSKGWLLKHKNRSQSHAHREQR